MRYHHIRSVREALQFLSKRHDIQPIKRMPNTTPPQVTRENKFRDVMCGGVYDESQHYDDYKDLNDYLRGKKAK